MKIFFSILVALLLSVVGICQAEKQTSGYPSKAIRWIVTYPPGGGTDIVARMIAPLLSQRLGQPVVVDNRGGASGMIGTELCARAPNDGHTLLLGTSSGLLILPLLSRKMPFDTFKDFVAISLIVVIPQMLVVNPSLALHSVKDLIATAKAQPGQLRYATAGLGSPNHLATELLSYMTHVQMTHVPYKGAAAGIIDVISGQIQWMFNPMPALMPQVRAGKLRARAVSGAQRSLAVPDLPTVAESGVPGYEYVLWYGMFGPAKIDRSIVSRLNQELSQILSQAEMGQALMAQGAEVKPTTPDQFLSFMRADAKRIATVIRLANIQLD